MNVVFLFFYIIFFLLIIANSIKVVKVIKRNWSSSYNNIENITEEFKVKSNHTYTNNMNEKNKDLDDFMKANTNPIKEKRGKRSNI